LRKLGWKKWLLITVPIVIIIILVVVVAVPAIMYYSRNRHPVDYSETLAQATAVYSVTYDSGDGLTDNSTFTRKVIETGVKEESQICFHEVTVYDPYPRRRVSSILGSMTFKLGTEEVWRDQGDLRVVEKMSLETDLPVLNTLKMISTYSQYVDYPGWPYHLGDSWTYQELATPDSPLQKAWTNTWRADVVSDNAMVQVGDKQYQCFEVVHTLTDTTNPHPAGTGIGGTIVEYWYGGGKTIGPIKQVDSINYKGIEIQTITGDVPLSVF
jgi:flagellar basal body-associated protein FliL